METRFLERVFPKRSAENIFFFRGVILVEGRTSVASDPSQELPLSNRLQESITGTGNIVFGWIERRPQEEIGEGVWCSQ